MQWHPSGANLFVNAGAGFATVTATESAGSFSLSVTETGAGFVLGGGYDIPIKTSGALAISPFFNWVITTVGPTYDFFQAGAGLTFN